MGLSAQQCRLLTITGRKSDCEFRSMALSHEKIALSREMADISNEYQNSLDRTKLVYDYYGKGDNSTALSYGVLMTPSALNDYTPVTLSDTTGKIILDRRWAAAAKYAGIPQEGIGGMPSAVVRQRFLEGLFGNGVINGVQRDRFSEVPYSQLAGVGGGGTLTVFTDEIDRKGLINLLSTTKAAQGNMTAGALQSLSKGVGDSSPPFEILTGNGKTTDTSVNQVYLSDLLTGNYALTSLSQSDACVEADNGDQGDDEKAQSLNRAADAIIDWLEGAFSAVFTIPGDPSSTAAIDYATLMMKTMFQEKAGSNLKGTVKHDNKKVKAWGDAWHGSLSSYSPDKVKGNNQSYLGVVTAGARQEDLLSNQWYHAGSAGALNLSNMAEAYLTLIAKFMDPNGLDSPDNPYGVALGDMGSNRLSRDNSKLLFTVYCGDKFSAEEAKMAAFYDTVMNQLCVHGWTEDNQITNNEHLQELLQNGKAFVNRMKDDGYYYQSNYSTDIYIKTITDDSYIAKAEARYSANKAKLNQKEQMLDLKMKNLDTEISALTTEYDTIKSTISKNIEKTFKRYG